MYFNICPVCGATLDPGERCEDCRKRAKRIKETEKRLDQVIVEDGNGQLTLELEIGK